jgi:hypothetical protein
MKYYFGKYNNYLEIDKYNRINKQVQKLIELGYIFCNGRVLVPEVKAFIAGGYSTVIDSTSLTVEKTGWYRPRDLVGDKFFVHKGQLVSKKVVDFSGLTSKMMFDSPIDGQVCYNMQPNSFLTIEDYLFNTGIGAIKINDDIYDNHIFLLSNFYAMQSIDDFYRLYIFEASDGS